MKQTLALTLLFAMTLTIGAVPASAQSPADHSAGQIAVARPACAHLSDMPWRRPEGHRHFAEPHGSGGRSPYAFRARRMRKLPWRRRRPFGRGGAVPDHRIQGTKRFTRRSAQPGLLQLPRGRHAHQLAGQRTRGQRQGLHRLPHRSRGERSGDRADHAGGSLLHLPRQRARRLVQVLTPSNARGQSGVQRLSQPARFAGRHEVAEGIHRQRDLLQLPRRQARAVAVGTSAGARQLRELPQSARLE